MKHRFCLAAKRLFNSELVFFSFLESAWMLNCKLRLVVLSVGECNHMGLKGFRGLESVTGDAGVTRGPGGLKEITGVTTGYRGLQKTAKLAFFQRGSPWFWSKI